MLVTTNYEELKIEPLNKNAPKIFIEVISKLNKLNNFWVSAGTALGLYRDKEFIPGDTDLDFACIGDGMDQIIESLQDFKVCRTIIDDDDKPMQLCLIKDDVMVDIYFHYLEGDNYVNYSGSGKQSMPRQIYDRLELIDTKYGKIPFPSPMEEYFKIRYGVDWKTPQEKKPYFEPAKGFPIEYTNGMIFGTFDPLHFGHIRLFKNAKRFCHHLHVVAEDDDVIMKEKHAPFTTTAERIEDLKGIKYIDNLVVRTIEHDRKYWVDKLKPNVLFLGTDWKDKDWEGKHLGVPIIYIERTKEIDSTYLRKIL